MKLWISREIAGRRVDISRVFHRKPVFRSYFYYNRSISSSVRENVLNLSLISFAYVYCFCLTVSWQRFRLYSVNDSLKAWKVMNE